MSAPNHDQREHPASTATAELDARDLGSPLPVLRAHRALRELQPGQQLRVLTSHPQTVTEFQLLAKHVPGYELVSQEEREGSFVHLLLRRR
jgi:TusA-related sulfurtransferase